MNLLKRLFEKKIVAYNPYREDEHIKVKKVNLRSVLHGKRFCNR